MGVAAGEHAYKDSIACAMCGAEWGLCDGAPVAEPAGSAGHLAHG
jgi:nitrite reductase/ring-hydroxylating ferredoxin subunit